MTILYPNILLIQSLFVSYCNPHISKYYANILIYFGRAVFLIHLLSSITYIQNSKSLN